MSNFLEGGYFVRILKVCHFVKYPATITAKWCYSIRSGATKATSHYNPLCHVCASDVETVEHHVFNCQFSRICHFVDPIALRTEALTGPLRKTFLLIGSQLDEEQWTCFLNSLWSIWQCHNDMTYGSKKANISLFKQYLRSISWESDMRVAASRGRAKGGADPNREEISLRSHVCYTDGAWLDKWNGGIGFLLFYNEELQFYRSSKTMGCSALKSKHWHLRRPSKVQTATGMGITECSFLSDCLVLVNAVNSFSPPSQGGLGGFHSHPTSMEPFQAESFL